jgi:hypothetical protein
MALPIEPHMPGTAAQGCRPSSPSISPEEQRPVIDDDAVTLSGGGEHGPSTGLRHQSTASIAEMVQTMHPEIAGASDGVKKPEDKLPPMSLAFSYLPLAGSLTKAVVHLVMKDVLASQESRLDDGAAPIKDAPQPEEKNVAGGNIPRGTDNMLTKAEAGDLESLKRLAAMMGNDSGTEIDAQICLPRLETLVSGAAGKGLLLKSRDHFEAYQGICRGVMKRFPEHVTGEFLKNEVLPLCDCPPLKDEDDIMMLWAAWAANPALVPSGMKYLTSREMDDTPGWNELHTVELAMDSYDYRPDAPAATWLFKVLDKLSKDSSGTKSFEKEQALNCLVKAKEKDPGLMAGITLTSGDKEGAPATREIFHSLKEAPDYKPDRHWQDSWTTSLLKLSFPDGVLEGELLSSLGAAIDRRGSVNSLGSEECRDLQTLAVLRLEPRGEERFLDLLGGDLLDEQAGNDHAWIVDRARGRELRRGLDHIPQVPAEARLDEVLRLLEIAQIDKSMMNREYWSERIVPAAFPPGGMEIRRSIADSLWDGFAEAYGRAGALESLGRRDTAALMVIESLSQAGDDSLSSKLTELLLAELRTGKTPKDGAPYYICQRLRKKRITDNIRRIAVPSTRGEDRKAIIDETRDLLGQIIWDRKDLSRLLEDTINASVFIEDTQGALEKNGADSPVQLVHEDDDAWLVLDGIRLKVNESTR